MTHESLIDLAIRHQVLLERLKSGQVANMAKAITDAESEIVRVLQGVEGGSVSALTAKQFNSLLSQLKQVEQTYLTGATGKLSKELQTLAGYEAKLEAKAVNRLVENELKYPDAAKAYAGVLKNPISATGELLQPFVNNITPNQLKKTEALMRRAWTEGWTVQQAVQGLRGTKSGNFKNGITALKKRQAEAVVRTSIQHVANAARMETWAANGDIINGYQWLSTLDSKTTPQCQALDGQKFRLGKGPTPPIHINCRSTTIPDLDDDLDFLDKGATRSALNGPVDADMTYFDWLKQQDRKFIEDTLGKERAALFLDRGLTPEQFRKLSIDKTFRPLRNAEMKRQLDGAIPFDPAPGTKTGRLWNLADNMKDELGRTPTSSEFLARSRAEGFNDDTAKTQLAKWRKDRFPTTPPPTTTTVPPAPVKAFTDTEATQRLSKLELIDDDPALGGKMFTHPMNNFDPNNLPAQVDFAERNATSFAARKTEEIRFTDLTIHQATVSEAQLRAALTREFNSTTGRPLAIRSEGKTYLIDGNHRVTAEFMKGRKSLPIDIIDLDAVPTQVLPPTPTPTIVTRVGMPGTGATRQVWQTADELALRLGRDPTRTELLVETRKLGLNDSTASTQFGKWKKAPLSDGTAPAVRPATRATAPKPTPAKPTPPPPPVDKEAAWQALNAKLDKLFDSTPDGPRLTMAELNAQFPMSTIAQNQRDWFDYNHGEWKPGTPESVKKFQRDYSAAYRAATSTSNAARAVSKDDVLALLRRPVGERANLKVRFGKVPESIKSQVATAKEMFEAVVSPRIVQLINAKKQTGLLVSGGADRGSFNSWDWKIKLGVYNRGALKTVIHEITHAIEYVDKDIADKTRAFLMKRAGGQPTKRLKDLVPGCYKDAAEIAYEDEWAKRGGDHYTGREYGSYGRATELLTMGIERLVGDPIGFRRQDKEFFDFIVRTLNDL